MNELIEHFGARAKDVTSLITAVSAAAYAFGYLSLRARALVLGTEPGLELLNAAYVFAGFRFLLVTGFFLLPVIPVLAAIRSLSAPIAAVGISPWLDGVGALALGVAVFTQFAYVGSRQGLLLHKQRKWPSDGQRFLLSLISTALVGVNFYWLAETSAEVRSGQTLQFALLLILGLQLVALAMLHGAFYADRVARQLTRAPEGIDTLVGPVWLIDRGKDRVSVFGHDSTGAPRLFSLPANKLDGIAVMKLDEDFNLMRAPRVPAQVAAALLGGVLLLGGVTLAKSADAQNTGNILKSAWTTLEAVPRMLGTLGESGVERGAVWEFRVADATRRRLSADDNLAYPIWSDGAVLAIQGRRVVRLDGKGAAAPLPGPEAEWVKLIAGEPEGVLGIVGYAAPRLALLRADGSLQEFPAAEPAEDRQSFAALQMESREYMAGKLRIGPVARDKNQMDVYFEAGGASVNVSDAGSSGAGHPFLTPDSARVLYVVQLR